jgi:enoyl-CoA hydratase/carnithine racemase
MSSDSDAKKTTPHRMVKWSPPYRRETVEQPDFDLVEIERDGPIGRIVLNTPEKRNPLGYERLLQIEMAAKLLELDEEVRVLIIKGQGPSFSAGYDITPVKRGERQRNIPPGGYIHPERDRLWQSDDLACIFGWRKRLPAMLRANRAVHAYSAHPPQKAMD